MLKEENPDRAQEGRGEERRVGGAQRTRTWKPVGENDQWGQRSERGPAR